MDSHLRIIELRTDNFKRLRSVAVRPDGSLIVVGGRNGQGKSSLLDSIECALAGASVIPVEPVRHGARKARIVLNLGELVVERTFSAKGTQLVVKTQEGVPQPSPQRLLDTLIAKVTFDPLEFARMDPPKQDELLKRVLGLDFSELDAARKKLYEERTEHNRDAKKLSARLDAMPEHRDAPKDVVDVAELTVELQRRTEQKAARQAHQGEIEQRTKDLARNDADQVAKRKAIWAAAEQMVRAQEELETLERDRETLLASILEAEQTIPEALPIDEVQQQLKTAEATNAKVRANRERAKLAGELERVEAAAAECTGAIASLDDEKARELSEAQFPIPGLGFDETGPTLNGVPLAQASAAEKLRVSVAIGAALNPRVKVMLVRDGSLLDDDSMRLLAELAAETGSQVWVERVGTKDPSAVVIEDGEVVGGAGDEAAPESGPRAAEGAGE